jgi:tetratricopeptide (TPR) repeat protein
MTRLEKLQEFLKNDPNDSFTRYCIGLEYRSAKDYPNAILSLDALRHDDPDYLPTYYQLADCYHLTEDNAKSIECYKQGISVARLAGDTHTASELQMALDELEDGM